MTYTDDAARPRTLPESELADLIDTLTGLRADMLAAATRSRTTLGEVDSTFRDSALNLIYYLALRRRDLRGLQTRLAALGLSSLGRAESHVMATLDSVLEALHHLAGRPWTPPGGPATLGFEGGQHLLAMHTETLLGASPPGRGVRIMVTMPSEAAEDYSLVHGLLKQGMNCMRINCAHDDPAAWSRMIEHLRRAEAALGKSCRVLMDLAGPKLRTGPLEPGPAVVKVRPGRDPLGRMTAPARVWLTPEEAPRRPPSPADVCLPVPGDWLSTLRTGEGVRFRDTRGASRLFTVVDVIEDGCWAEALKTAYLVPGTVLRSASLGREAPVGDLPFRENALLLHKGDVLILTSTQNPGRPATVDSTGRVLSPATLGCTLPEVFDDVRAGERVWLDDGKIGGVVDRVEPGRIFVRITHARVGGEKLRGGKGINLPDSRLRLSALSAKDIEDLKFVVEHADLVALSFARSAQDVELLQEHMARLSRRLPAVVLKIETRRGFDNLPAMLLKAMRMPCCGVMIARGDLAVECGFERLAEVQEEILWISEAAHVPVIWATQVLENLAKEGMPSRAEITDAAMGHRAECVMLNKGPHVTQAVQVLDEILRRMETHQAKKRAMMRELRLAHAFGATEGPL